MTYNETASYRASSDTATLGTKKFNTRLRCASSTINGVAGSQISVWGLLEQENASGDWRALPNETITLRLDGTSKSATTDSRGMGSANYTIDSVGNYTYTASYGGDSDHEDSSGSGTVKIANPPVNAGITSVLFADTSARISRDNAIPRATIKNVGTTSASFLLKHQGRGPGRLRLVPDKVRPHRHQPDPFRGPILDQQRQLGARLRARVCCHSRGFQQQWRLAVRHRLGTAFQDEQPVHVCTGQRPARLERQHRPEQRSGGPGPEHGHRLECGNGCRRRRH